MGAGASQEAAQEPPLPAFGPDAAASVPLALLDTDILVAPAAMGDEEEEEELRLGGSVCRLRLSLVSGCQAPSGSSGDEAAGLGTEWQELGPPAFLLTISGLDYTSLLAEPRLKAQAEEAAALCVCRELSLVDGVRVRAFGCTRLTQLAVIAPPRLQRPELEATLLQSAGPLGLRLEAALSQLQLPLALYTGVSNISPVTYAMLVNHQGSWEKDEFRFAIIGDRIRFPDGSRCVLHPTCSTVFRVKQRSNKRFLVAKMSDDGQRLMWSNGSVWQRAANVVNEMRSRSRSQLVAEEKLEAAPEGPDNTSSAEQTKTKLCTNTVSTADSGGGPPPALDEYTVDV